MTKAKKGRRKQVRVATQICVDFVRRIVTIESTGKEEKILSAPIPENNQIHQDDSIGDFKPYIADVDGKPTDRIFEAGIPFRIWFRCQLLHNGEVYKTFPVFKSGGQVTHISDWPLLGNWTIRIEALRRRGTSDATYSTDLGGGRSLPPWVRHINVLHAIPCFVCPLEPKSECDVFNRTPTDLALSFEDSNQKATEPDELYEAVLECEVGQFEHSGTELRDAQLIIKNVVATNLIGDAVNEIELAVRLRSKEQTNYVFERVYWRFKRPTSEVHSQDVTFEDITQQRDASIDENETSDSRVVAVPLSPTSIGFTSQLFNFHFFDDLTKLHHQRRALLKQIPDIVEDVKKARANVDKFIENCFNADTEGVSDQLDNSFKTTSKKVAEAIASLEREQRDVMLRNEQRRQSQSNNMTEYSSNQVLIVDQRCRRDNTLKLAPKPLLGFVAELIKQLKNLHKKEIYFTELLHEKQTEETKLTLEIENCRKAHRPDQGAKKRSAPTVNLNGKRSHTS